MGRSLTFVLADDILDCFPNTRDLPQLATHPYSPHYNVAPPRFPDAKGCIGMLFRLPYCVCKPHLHPFCVQNANRIKCCRRPRCSSCLLRPSFRSSRFHLPLLEGDPPLRNRPLSFIRRTLRSISPPISRISRLRYAP